MYEEVYIDLVFGTNLLMDYFLIRLIGFLFKHRTSRIRSLMAALLGAGLSCLIFVIPVNFVSGMVNWSIKFMLHNVCAIWMIQIGCGLKGYRVLGKMMITLYLTAFLWGGFWAVLLEDRSITLKTFFLCAVGTYLGLSIMIRISDSMRTKRKNIYPITLMYQGKIHKAYGYYDTGNLLTEPYTGKPVSIIDVRFLEEIISEDVVETLRHFIDKQGELENTKFSGLHPCLIPYRTVGQTTGIMPGITLDELCIHTPGEVIHISEPVFGFTQEPSALEKECKVLLNSRFINQEGTT